MSWLAPMAATLPGMGSKARPAVAAQRWFQRGVRAANTGDLAAAEHAYHNAIAAKPDFSEAHTNLGTTLQLQGRLAEAQAAYRAATTFDPGNANAHANLGSVCCALGELDQAETFYRRAIELDSRVAHHHAGLGAVLHAQQHYVAASQALAVAIALAPMWSDPRRALGFALFRGGDHAAAVDACLAALALDSDDPTTHSVLGLALTELGHIDAAAVQLARVVELQPTSSTAHTNLGMALDRLERTEDAAESYRAAVQADGTNVPALLNFAGSMMRLGRIAEATGAYRAVLAVNPDEPSAAHLVAALTGENTTTAPAGYVRALFDDTATKFETHLRGLDYSAPTTIRRCLETAAESPLSRLLDIGCGTGMVGAEVRPLTAELCGVDLSSGMIAQAREQGHYDHLHVADVVDYLRAATDQFDAATAGDVLIYLGDLSPVMAALRARLRAGGLFVFSIENGEGTWQLTPSGRYTHGNTYVATVAQENGFELVAHDATVLRHEHGAPVEGSIFTFRLGDDAAPPPS